MNALVRWLCRGWLRQAMTGLISVLLLTGAVWCMTDRPIVIAVDIAGMASGDGQLFHARGLEFSEPQSMHFTMVHDGDARRHEFRIDGSRPPRWLRLDPARGPGEITVESVRFTAGSRLVEWQGSTLVDALEPLHDIQRAPGADGRHFVSTGPDPALRFEVPPDIRKSPPERIAIAAVLLLLGCVSGGLAVRAFIISIRAGLRPPVATTTAILTAAGFVAILAVLDIAPAFRPIEALQYGLPLFTGALGFTLIGAALDLEGRRNGRSRLFLWLLLGQAAAMAYLQLRSLATMVLGLPVTAWEMLALVAIATWTILRTRHAAPIARVTHDGWLYSQLALLLAVCLMVADRELPRLVMLSSDPDQHAFFALQVQRLGGLPWQQGPWGDQPLNYPGGTALLGAAWSWLAWSDSRNVITALPWITYFVAAFAIADAASERINSPLRRSAIALSTAGILAAAMLLPLYRHFVHQEGLGRILAFGFLALIATAWMGRPAWSIRQRLPVMTLGVFAIASLNPISLAGAAVLVGATTLWAALSRRRDVLLFLSLPLGVALVLADPYYLSMLSGQALGTGVALGPELVPVDLREGVIAGLQALAVAPLTHFAGALRLLPSAGWLVWLAPTLLSLALLATTSRRWLPPWQAIVAVAASIVVIAVTNAVAARFTTDPRLYLLAAYADVAFAQLRIVCALGLPAFALAQIASREGARSTHAALWMLGALLVAVSFVSGRTPQPWMTQPKWNYCGGLVCPHPDDVAALDAFSRTLRTGTPEMSVDNRLLTLNAVRDLGRERWLIPVGGSRLAPFLDLPPSAFFYFQGNDAFTTDSYDRHVCRRFDRDWLIDQGIGYVFLPAGRTHGCLAGADALLHSEEIVAQHGDAAVLRLRRAPRPSSLPEEAPQ
ncbi:hypothetical protein LDO31_05960 [Luteimonas sp. XNQY3]|nr:hypothetical protein [Luteimonas sp. XNQY3]MCD9005786.1 hypothetical protein [Luteimonas sp. XNQY3]